MRSFSSCHLFLSFKFILKESRSNISHGSCDVLCWSDWIRLRQMSVWDIVSLSPAIVSLCYYWPWAGDSISLEGRQSTVCTITCVTHYTRVTHYMLHQCFTLHQCPSCRYKGRSIKTSNCRWLSGYTTVTMKYHSALYSLYCADDILISIFLHNFRWVFLYKIFSSTMKVEGYWNLIGNAENSTCLQFSFNTRKASVVQKLSTLSQISQISQTSHQCPIHNSGGDIYSERGWRRTGTLGQEKCLFHPRSL